MGRAGRTGWSRAAVALSVALVAAVVWWVARPGRPDTHPSRAVSAAASPEAAGLPATLATPAAPRAERAEPAGEPAPEPQPLAREVELALSELCALLETTPLGRTRWDIAARGLAGSLGAESCSLLLATVSDPRCPSAELVAASELLRQLSGAIPRAVLARLRTAAYAGLPDAATATAARRVLAARGDWSDRLSLVRALEHARNDETRRAAVWCLRSAGAQDVFSDLAGVLERRPDPLAAELSILSLDAMARRGASVPDHVRDTVAEAVIEALGDPDVPAAVPARAMRLLGSLGGEVARASLERHARGGPARAAAAQALARLEDGAETLLAIVASPEVDQESKLVAAAALVRRPEPSAPAQSAAVDGLRLIRENGADPEDRRRAVLALAEGATDSSRRALGEALLEDADAGVRAAAVIAMTRFEGADHHREALEACARTDAVERVRELARRSLEHPGTRNPVRAE